MNRITARFEQLKKAGRKGLVGYLTAGDPNVETSEKNIRVALDNGVDVLELGVPFSDPTADGPTIQAAAYRALKAGMTLGKALDMVARLREDYDTPIVLFGYANPFFRYGYEKISIDAARASVDGMLVVDMPFGSGDDLHRHLAHQGIHAIPLIAPTTPPERAREILRHAQGFVYYIMVRGVTGARTNLASDVGERVRVLRTCTRLPIAVGFGVSNGEQARESARDADAVVVGSALVRAAEDGNLAQLVTEIRAALG
jgi:tryptophan synthase alpha chain